MTSDAGPADWSEPTLSGPEPEFTSVPFEPGPAARRQRIAYEQGEAGAWHPKLIERAADVAVAAMPIPLRVLDVGCGSGDLLDELILRVPYADMYVGVDPVRVARQTSDPHLCFLRAAAEALPFADATFDLVVATMSFGYWADQRAGAAELARVVTSNGKVVIVESVKRDAGHRHRPHTVKTISELLSRAGLRLQRTETVRRSMLLRPAARAFIASL